MRQRNIDQVAPGLALFLMVVASATGGIVYVDSAAPAGGSGASWATAHRHLQDGLASARAQIAAGPMEIRVAQGVYRPDRSEAQPGSSGDRAATFELTGGMSLVGGYAGIAGVDPNHRDPTRYPTVLSGDLAGDDVNVADPGKLRDEPTRSDNSWHVLSVAGPALLEAVTVVGGHAAAASDPHPQRGGGLHVAGEGVTIRDCVVKGNLAEEGGGLYADEAGTLLTGCVLGGNAAAWGGAIHSSCSRSLEVRNCLLSGNKAFNGGAACYGEGGMMKWLNCTAVGNKTPEGSFLLDITPRPARGSQPPAMLVDSCILADGGNEISNSYATLTIRYTNVVGGRPAVIDPQRTLVWGPGNVDVDPCFADPGHWDAGGTPADPNDDFFVAGDYHLRSREGRWEPSIQAWVSCSSAPALAWGGTSRSWPACPRNRRCLWSCRRVSMAGTTSLPRSTSE